MMIGDPRFSLPLCTVVCGQGCPCAGGCAECLPRLLLARTPSQVRGTGLSVLRSVGSDPDGPGCDWRPGCRAVLSASRFCYRQSPPRRWWWRSPSALDHLAEIASQRHLGVDYIKGKPVCFSGGRRADHVTAERRESCRQRLDLPVRDVTYPYIECQDVAGIRSELRCFVRAASPCAGRKRVAVHSPLEVVDGYRGGVLVHCVSLQGQRGLHLPRRAGLTGRRLILKTSSDERNGHPDDQGND